MKNKGKSVARVVGTILGVIIACFIVLVLCWAVCVVGQLVYTTFGIGGLVMLSVVVFPVILSALSDN